MLDFSHLTDPKGVDQQFFDANSPSAGANWVSWIKPRGINWTQFTVFGGGGAGGAGYMATVASSGGGGGGRRIMFSI